MNCAKTNPALLWEEDCPELFLPLNKMNSFTNYDLHQTPADLGRDLTKLLPLEPTDILYEPFRGDGAFYNAFPEANPKLWAEIVENKDFRTVEEPYDWVITNPPFRVDGFGKTGNAIFPLLDYFVRRAKKGVAFLVSDQGLGTLTRIRRDALRALGWDLVSMTMCDVKKWRGRYYFLVFRPSTTTCLSYLPRSY